MDVGDLAESAALALIPPDLNPSRRQRYDLAVSLTLGGLIVAFIAHTAMACGYMAWIGISGFALNADVQQQSVQLSAILTAGAMHDVRDDKTQICRAQQSKNQAALTSWSRDLESARGRYFAVTHTWPDVPSCEELLVIGSEPLN